MGYEDFGWRPTLFSSGSAPHDRRGGLSDLSAWRTISLVPRPRARAAAVLIRKYAGIHCKRIVVQNSRAADVCRAGVLRSHLATFFPPAVVTFMTLLRFDIVPGITNKDGLRRLWLAPRPPLPRCWAP
jgi:hypothetical protein